ncbi:hypothetical protein EFA69_06530 [Rufibacter immobilis]|uniref:Uncharacterized protein n=1 Tax=Rufibacter immobilis TaxID=1348778 RepID=A0A3M9N1B3_9BACT|nr:hypothetical protein [Rufibacter immobilis]RNI30943.1 hypothetical protein EFA69_06530 [Rufibacter immobilis]
MAVSHTDITMAAVRKEILGDLEGEFYSPSQPIQNPGTNSMFSNSSPIFLKDLFFHSTLPYTPPYNLSAFAGYVHKPPLAIYTSKPEPLETQQEVFTNITVTKPNPQTVTATVRRTNGYTGAVTNLYPTIPSGSVSVRVDGMFERKEIDYTVTWEIIGTSANAGIKLNEKVCSTVIPALPYTEEPRATGVEITMPYTDWLDAVNAPLMYWAYTLSGSFGEGERIWLGDYTNPVTEPERFTYIRTVYGDLWLIDDMRTLRSWTP